MASNANNSIVKLLIQGKKNYLVVLTLHLDIIAWLGWQYWEIVSLRMAVLAQQKGGTTQNQKANPSPTQGVELCDLSYPS